MRYVATIRKCLWTALPYVVVAGVTALATVYVQGVAEAELQRARAAYRDECHFRAATVKAGVEDSFRVIYEQMRTIARLPGVRKLSGGNTGIGLREGGKEFGPDSKLAVQEIYNNLANSVDVSEVYIVPVELDPDGTGGAPKEPMITFDELIVGKTGEEHTAGAEKEKEAVEEIEIFEYRLMKKQLAWMKANCPLERVLQGLHYPAISGPEVVTCDNRYYRPTAPDDRSRSGIVYSVPFYDEAGALRGCISAVMLSYSIRHLLPEDGFVLMHTKQGHFITPEKRGTWEASQARWSRGEADGRLTYSEVLGLKGTDANGEWSLWCGQPEWSFWNRGEVKAALESERTRVAGIWVIGTMCGTVWHLLQKSRRNLVFRNAELETRVRERTDSLLDATRRAGMAEIATGVLHNVGNVLNSVNVSAVLLREKLGASKVENLGKATDMMLLHRESIGAFLEDDAKGRKLPEYLGAVSKTLIEERGALQMELSHLVESVSHIKEIIGAQQSAARVEKEKTLENIAELVEDAIRINAVALDKHQIEVVRLFDQTIAPVLVDKHGVLQVLINFVSNAKKAIEGNPAGARRIVFRIERQTVAGAAWVSMSVADSGVGIGAADLQKIFQHGFTTRRDGHGFGLHSAANEAKRMGGRVGVASDGVGMGATFTLEIPIEVANFENVKALCSETV